MIRQKCSDFRKVCFGLPELHFSVNSNDIIHFHPDSLTKNRDETV